ncbi:MAG TPA: hypothetical protein VFO29_06020 [Candidatus Rubrimentiphilum sp.]|nr:hypothetical protein [Candidatus Rubrimentiphilum sp.]
MRAFALTIVPLCALLAACEPAQENGSSQGVVIGAVTPWPQAAVAAPNDPPRILAAEISSDVIHPDSWWSGKVATTTNVAVVEMRSPSFSFILHRSSYGQFAFRTHVLAIPSIYRRGFEASIVARTANDSTDTRTVQLIFR